MKGHTMKYVEGFLLSVPTEQKQAYLEQAQTFALMVKEFGATRVVECWGDDLPAGRLADFRTAVKAEEGEAVVFSWIEYPSKEARDAANEKIMADERMKTAPALFDTKRMIFGGFVPIVEA
jgi:uncharacterized protein YbaA (DUF1428 family)